MQILWKKMRENKVSVRVDTLEDMWYLGNVISPGDVVYGRSWVRFESGDKLRSKKAERKAINIKLKVEKVEFHRSSDRFRVHGVIESGTPEAFVDFGSHHALNLELGDSIIIEKEWSRAILGILEGCEKRAPKLVVVSVDRGEAVFGFVKDFGVDYKTMRAQIPGKDQPEKIADAEKKFYSEVAEALSKYEFGKCVVCGAGFYKEDLFKAIKEKHSEIAGKCIMEHTGSSGENAVSEVMKKGILHRIAKESKLAEESALMEKLLTEIAKEGRATYGPAQVRNAAQAGAVEVLMITDEKLRGGELRDVIESAERGNGRLLIISVEHESGKQLEGLGGIAALTRYRVE
ncbi:MAG: mRNA surveillance protein pelota [archaeon]